MTILCIETSTSVCSVAWCVDGQCMAERIHTEGSNHAAILPLFIDELLQQAQQNGWQADAVAVSAGPGSYTGLRIGVSTAKGLCYGWKIPMIAVPTLDILHKSALVAHPHINGILIPMLDARRMEVYTALYSQQQSEWISTPVLAQVVKDCEWLPQNKEIYYFGDGAKKCQEVLKGEMCHFIDQIIPHAGVMGEVVQNYNYPPIQEKELAYFTPFYLKEFVAAPSHVKGLK